MYSVPTAKKVQFSEEVQVKTIEPPDEVEIDEVRGFRQGMG